MLTMVMKLTAFTAWKWYGNKSAQGKGFADKNSTLDKNQETMNEFMDILRIIMRNVAFFATICRLAPFSDMHRSTEEISNSLSTNFQTESINRS